MRMYFTAFLGAVLCSLIVLGSTVSAEEKNEIPYKLDQVQDPGLKDALATISPSYDTLGRGSQVFDYLNAYRQVHGGNYTDLTPTDSALVVVNKQPATVLPVEGESNPDDYIPAYAEPTYPFSPVRADPLFTGTTEKIHYLGEAPRSGN